MATKAINATVTGRVQGVGFRYAARRTALTLGVDGWVRNRADGSVEVRAQGNDDVVAELVAFLHEGPFGAQVQLVTTTDVTADPTLTGFEVRH